MAEYDKIAEAYANSSKEHIGKIYSYEPSLFKAFGDLRGKKVLDLACGDGFLSRELKKRGAKEVTGVDLSSEMIKIAREKENKNPLGIKYILADVINMGKLGEFDLVVGGFLLHYSKTSEELFSMCKNIFLNLKNGGKFVAINNNPINPLAGEIYKKYSDTCEAKNEPLKEGDELIIKIWTNGKEVCTFLNYHWKKSTYDSAFKEAGFKKVNWISLGVSEEGLNKFGKEFWNDFYNNGYLIIIEATKD